MGVSEKKKRKEKFQNKHTTREIQKLTL